MNRLTKEQILNATANKYFDIGGRIYGKTMFAKMTTELVEYKNIEEELGIDLITLLKALKNGCFAKETFDYMGKSQTQIIFTNFTYLYYADDIGAYFIHIRTKDYYLNEYGKTWSLGKNDLTKEELEK